MAVSILGLGGCGNNFLEYLAKRSSILVEGWGINTDPSIFSRKNLSKKALIEFSRVHAFHSEEKAWYFYESKETFYRDILNGTKFLILVYGAGGKSGLHLALEINKLAKELNIFTINVAILPFSFEGEERAKRAQNLISSLFKYADLVYLLRNDYLLKTTPPHIKISKMFEIFDAKIENFLKMVLNNLNSLSSL